MTDTDIGFVELSTDVYENLEDYLIARSQVVECDMVDYMVVNEVAFLDNVDNIKNNPFLQQAYNYILQKLIVNNKIYNTKSKMHQYISIDGQILITCKTEKGLESNWIKYKKVFGL